VAIGKGDVDVAPPPDAAKRRLAEVVVVDAPPDDAPTTIATTDQQLQLPLDENGMAGLRVTAAPWRHLAPGPSPHRARLDRGRRPWRLTPSSPSPRPSRPDPGARGSQDDEELSPFTTVDIPRKAMSDEVESLFPGRADVIVRDGAHDEPHRPIGRPA